MNENPNHTNQPSDPDFLYALRREMPRSFGEALYAQLGQAETGDETTMEATLHPPKTYIRRRGRPFTLQGGVHILTLAAVMILFTLVGGLMLTQFAHFSLRNIQPGAQPTPPPLNQLAPIIDANTASLSKLYTLGNGTVHDIAWSPDSQTVALATSRGVYLHDAEDLETAPMLLGGQTVSTHQIVYSQDGHQLAGVRREGETSIIYVWEVATGEVLARFPSGFLSPALLGFTANGTQLVGYGCIGLIDPNQRTSLCTGMAVARWHTEDGERVGALIDMDIQYEVGPSLSENGEKLAFVNADPPAMTIGSPMVSHSITIVDLTDDRRATLPIYGSGVFVTLNEDGSKLIVMDRGNVPRLELLDVTTFLNDPEQALKEVILLNQLYLSDSPIGPLPLTFLPDDAGLLARNRGRDDGYVIYPLEGSGEARQTGLPFLYFDRFVVSPDGSRVITGLNGDWLEIRELMGGQILTSTRAYNSVYDHLSFTPDGDTLIAGGSSLWGTVRGFDLSAEPPSEVLIQPEAIFGLAGETVDYSAARLIYSPDGSQAYYSMRNAHQQIIPVRRDLVTGDTILGQTFGIPGLIAFTPENELLQLDRGQSVRRYSADLSTTPDYTLVTLQGSPDINVNAVPRALFTPDGRMIIASVCLNRPSTSQTMFTNDCWESELRAYSLNSGGLLAALEGEDSLQSSELILTSDGRYLAASSCENLILSTDPQTRSECTAFTLRVWDLSSLYELLDAEPEDDRSNIAPLPVPDEETITRLAPVAISQVFDRSFYGLAFAPVEAESKYDSLFLATNDAYASPSQVRLWRVSLNADAPDAAFTQIGQIPASGIWGLAFSPDGTLLVMGGEGLVELWGTTTE